MRPGGTPFGNEISDIYAEIVQQRRTMKMSPSVGSFPVKRFACKLNSEPLA